MAIANTEGDLFSPLFSRVITTLSETNTDPDFQSELTRVLTARWESNMAYRSLQSASNNPYADEMFDDLTIYLDDRDRLNLVEEGAPLLTLRLDQFDLGILHDDELVSEVEDVLGRYALDLVQGESVLKHEHVLIHPAAVTAGDVERLLLACGDGDNLSVEECVAIEHLVDEHNQAGLVRASVTDPVRFEHFVEKFLAIATEDEKLAYMTSLVSQQDLELDELVDLVTEKPLAKAAEKTFRDMAPRTFEAVHINVSSFKEIFKMDLPLERMTMDLLLCEHMLYGTKADRSRFSEIAGVVERIHWGSDRNVKHADYANLMMVVAHAQHVTLLHRHRPVNDMRLSTDLLRDRLSNIFTDLYPVFELQGRLPKGMTLNHLLDKVQEMTITEDEIRWSLKFD